MKKICKLILYIMLCAVIFSLSLCLFACDKDEYGISQFYGVYESQYDYCMVSFMPQSENKDYDLFYASWDITSVGNNSFTYVDNLHGGQLVEKECDAFLLKSLKRLIGDMSKTVTLSDGLIYLNDLDQNIKYDYVYHTSDMSNEYWILYKNKIEVCDVICSKDEIDDIELYCALYDDYVIDENGVEWEIIVRKSFIRNN